MYSIFEVIVGLNVELKVRSY